ncbi:hypothetical protein ACX80O_02240 [Arthrobacter sp. Hz1]
MEELDPDDPFPISENVRRKYYWAVRHLRQLESEIGELRSKHIYDSVPNAHTYFLDEKLVEITFTAKVHERAPEHWGQIIGDIASALRSTLDQAVIDLVSRSTDLGPSDIKKRSFPIIGIEADNFEREFAKARKKQIAGLSEKQIAVIKSVQPVKLELNPIRWSETLAEISNVHKHRGFLEVGHIAMLKKLNLGFPAQVLEFSTPRVALEDGTYLGRVLFWDTPRKTEGHLEVEGQSLETLKGVPLPDHSPISQVLQVLLNHVYETLCRLAESDPESNIIYP